MRVVGVEDRHDRGHGRIPCGRIITKVTSLDSAPGIVAQLHGGATDHVKVLLRP
jgi:threonine dehydrogenase-like Zn-dependent dehydrogenase